MKVVQILYPEDTSSGRLHHYFQDEAEEMHQNGFLVDVVPLNKAEIIIKRGFTIKVPENYPSDVRMIQGWKANLCTLDFTSYGHLISPWTIPFEVVASLNESEVKGTLKKNGWKKVFIKSKNTSLFAFGENASVYPISSIESMRKTYEKIGETGPFVIREFIDNPEIFYNEQRYWILNGRAYHPSGIIPDFVEEAGYRVFKSSGSKYFTIDVAGDYIVEVNPGESSDRGGDTPLSFFSEIFAKEFLGK